MKSSPLHSKQDEKDAEPGSPGWHQSLGRAQLPWAGVNVQGPQGPHPYQLSPVPRVKDPMATGDDCGHIRFFSFSLIEGYISLVMDVQTQQR